MIASQGILTHHGYATLKSQARLSLESILLRHGFHSSSTICFRSSPTAYKHPDTLRFEDSKKIDDDYVPFNRMVTHDKLQQRFLPDTESNYTPSASQSNPLIEPRNDVVHQFKENYRSPSSARHSHRPDSPPSRLPNLSRNPAAGSKFEKMGNSRTSTDGATVILQRDKAGPPFDVVGARFQTSTLSSRPRRHHTHPELGPPKDRSESDFAAENKNKNKNHLLNPSRPLEGWQIQKKALKEKFGSSGWSPRKRLSPDDLEGVRTLHSMYPDEYTTPVLANHYEVSPEAIRRILKSKWRPNEEEEAKRRERWKKRGKNIWSQMVEIGIKPPQKWRQMGVGKAKKRSVRRDAKGKVSMSEPLFKSLDTRRTPRHIKATSKNDQTITSTTHKILL